MTSEERLIRAEALINQKPGSAGVPSKLRVAHAQIRAFAKQNNLVGASYEKEQNVIGILAKEMLSRKTVDPETKEALEAALSLEV